MRRQASAATGGIKKHLLCAGSRHQRHRHGRSEIFNPDQGSQFASAEFTGLLLTRGIAISMDGRGARTITFITERLWRSVKYKEVYLRAYGSVGQARTLLRGCLVFHNRKRPHSSLDARTRMMSIATMADKLRQHKFFLPSSRCHFGRAPPCSPTDEIFSPSQGAARRFALTSRSLALRPLR